MVRKAVEFERLTKPIFFRKVLSYITITIDYFRIGTVNTGQTATKIAKSLFDSKCIKRRHHMCVEW